MAKIADVGLAKIMPSVEPFSWNDSQKAGTFAYAAPEIIMGARCTKKVHSLPASE